MQYNGKFDTGSNDLHALNALYLYIHLFCLPNKGS